MLISYLLFLQAVLKLEDGEDDSDILRQMENIR